MKGGHYPVNIERNTKAKTIRPENLERVNAEADSGPVPAPQPDGYNDLDSDDMPLLQPCPNNDKNSDSDSDDNSSDDSDDDSIPHLAPSQNAADENETDDARGEEQDDDDIPPLTNDVASSSESEVPSLVEDLDYSSSEEDLDSSDSGRPTLVRSQRVLSSDSSDSSEPRQVFLRGGQAGYARVLYCRF